MAPKNDRPDCHKTLQEGVRKFHKELFPPKQKDYEHAEKSKQKPHTLFITCSDSRIATESLTQTGCGDMFVTRNIGNIVPAYGEIQGGVSAVIEYAVSHLKVSQVVVCGHSDCGAMKGLLNRESVSELPAVDHWLQNADAALSVVHARNPKAKDEALLPELIEENVRLQLSQLLTHPSVAGRVAAKKLALYGWVYEIGTGTVRELDPQQGKFVPLD